MARTALPNDFVVPVDGIGSFTFGRRTMRDEMKIQVEYAKYIDGATPTDWLASVAGWIACLNVMTVRAPDGWNIDEMDPLDDDTYEKIAKVYGELDKKERSFRPKRIQASEASGAQSIVDSGVLVSPQVQPNSE